MLTILILELSIGYLTVENITNVGHGIIVTEFGNT